MKELFDNLMSLCETCDKGKFFFKDQEGPSGAMYRIFNYNYASYTDWCEDDALEARGIMFEIDEYGPVRIACRPMEKFFNLNETPFTMNLDLSQVELVMTKEDGSLISSFIDAGHLRLKSKGSMFSEQALSAYAFVRADEHQALFDRVEQLSKDGYTCNFEYTSPTNRIVLAYQEQFLTLLNVRHNETGEYVPYSEIFADGVLRPYLVKAHKLGRVTQSTVDSIRAEEGIEGFIFVLNDGTKFKLKTAWYSALHHTKDSINNNKDLFACIVAGGSDDLKAMFSSDAYAIEKITTFEEIHLNYLSYCIELIGATIRAGQGHERKKFAQDSQLMLKDHPELFGYVMSTFAGEHDMEKMVEYVNKAFLKHYKPVIPEKFLKVIVQE